MTRFFVEGITSWPNREGYILQGTGPYYPRGISLSGRNTITIENVEIKRFSKPIFLGSTPIPDILFFL